MSDENRVVRVERLERLAATGFCAMPIALGVLCLSTVVMSMILEVIFMDYGVRLRSFSQSTGMRVLWSLLAFALPAASIWIARNRQPEFSILFSTFAGLALLAVALLVLFGACSPFFTVSHW